MNSTIMRTPVFISSACALLLSCQPALPDEDSTAPATERAALAAQLAYWASFTRPDGTWEVVRRPASDGPQAAFDAATSLQKSLCQSDFTCEQRPIRLVPIVTAPGDSAVDNVQAWFQAAQEAVLFLRSSNVPVNSARVSLEAMELHIRSIREEVARKAARKDGEIARISDDAQKAIRDHTEAAGELEKATLAETKLRAQRLAEVLQRGKERVEQLAPSLKALTARFKAYQQTEAAFGLSARTVSTDAAQADLSQTQDLKIRIIQLGQAESVSADSLVLDAYRLAADLETIQAEHEIAMGSLRDLADQQGVGTVDLVGGSLAHLRNIIAYVDTRKRAAATTIQRVYAGLRARSDGLIASGAAQQTQATLAQAAFLSASSKFLDEITARSLELKRSPPVGKKLKVPLLAEQYDRMSAFLQLESLCTAGASTVPTWRDAGCQAVKRDVALARNFLSTRLPSTLRINIAFMRNAGLPAGAIADIEQRVAANQWKAAALSNDAALMAWDLQ